MDPQKYDFGGYATRYNVQCGDGRIIRPEAFKDIDGEKVPLVYHHIHDDLSNVLGHAMLEHRNDGIYAYCSFNNSEKAQLAKEAVNHGDIVSLSVYANKLKQRSNEVLHGVIREVSLVLSGANPQAKIDNVAFKHGDDFEESASDVIIYSGVGLEVDSSLSHQEAMGDPAPKKETDEEGTESSMADTKEKTVQDVYNEFTDEQKLVVDALVGAAVEAAENGEIDIDVDDEEDEVTIKQSGIGGSMRHNVFETCESDTQALSHADIELIFDEMKRGSTMRETMLEHGITSVEVLFPEARSVTTTPETISRQMEWVTDFLGSVRKSPFSRVKSTAVNITADEARAKGYVKGRQKAEEVIVALKRVTTPQTVYKKQALDRDDIIDITDFDVVAFINAEMRVMLNEEIARAALIGDGRSVSADDKINPLNIRPVWGDDSVYVTNSVVEIAANTASKDKVEKFIDDAIMQRKNYKGSGRPTCYMGTDLLTACRLLKDSQGYRRYKTDQELADDLRVAKIVEVELFDGQTRTVDAKTYELAAIIVNPMDYTIGADKGGEISNFDDFDIDFNKHKYLIETRISGALTKPKSALTFEFTTTA